MTVAEMLSRISSAELAEWMAFHILSQRGPDDAAEAERKMKKLFGVAGE